MTEETKSFEPHHRYDNYLWRVQNEPPLLQDSSYTYSNWPAQRDACLEYGFHTNPMALEAQTIGELL